MTSRLSRTHPSRTPDERKLITSDEWDNDEWDKLALAIMWLDRETGVTGVPDRPFFEYTPLSAAERRPMALKSCRAPLPFLSSSEAL